MSRVSPDWRRFVLESLLCLTPRNTMVFNTWYYSRFSVLIYKNSSQDGVLGFLEDTMRLDCLQGSEADIRSTPWGYVVIRKRWTLLNTISVTVQPLVRWSWGPCIRASLSVENISRDLILGLIMQLYWLRSTRTGFFCTLYYNKVVYSYFFAPSFFLFSYLLFLDLPSIILVVAMV